MLFLLLHLPHLVAAYATQRVPVRVAELPAAAVPARGAQQVVPPGLEGGALPWALPWALPRSRAVKRSRRPLRQSVPTGSARERGTLGLVGVAVPPRQLARQYFTKGKERRRLGIVVSAPRAVGCLEGWGRARRRGSCF